LPVGVEHYMQMRPGIDVVPSPAVLGQKRPLSSLQGRVCYWRSFCRSGYGPEFGG
jgi:hypothetical protein